MASGSKKVIYAALIGNSLIAVTKFVAAALTGSSAMLSEGIHSVVDTGNQVLLLHGLRRAQKPPDAQFPFGHGKEIYFWSFVVAILIFAVGAGVSLYEGTHHILHPEEIKNPVINYIVLGLAMVFEGFALFFAVNEFSKVKGSMGYIQAVQSGKDPSMFVVLFEDSAAMLGLVVAFFGVFLAQITGVAVWDGIASVIIGLILGATAIWLACETKGLLIGEAADPALAAGIEKLAGGYEEIRKVNKVLTLHMGPEYILVNLSIEFANDLKVGTLERLIEKLTREIKSQNANVKRVFIEAEDFTPHIK